tara:strand:+ start:341 stop:703 length:363 start_codon:yes stop_codon:yes gene_type:complete
MIKISTRLIILFPKIVLKFPLGRRGYLQSKNEKIIWDKYKNNYPLGTLHWEFLGVVCMKRYKQVAEIPTKTVMLAKHIIKEFDIDRCDLYNSENWGIKNKQYYLIDYGISQYISTLYKNK